MQLLFTAGLLAWKDSPGLVQEGNFPSTTIWILLFSIELRLTIIHLGLLITQRTILTSTSEHEYDIIDNSQTLEEIIGNTHMSSGYQNQKGTSSRNGSVSVW